MGPVRAISTCLRKYATFSGRASRSEYWWFGLAVILTSIVALIIDTVVFDALNTDGYMITPVLELFSLALLLPSWSVAVRRMQDIGQNGKIWFWAFAMYYTAVYFGTFLDITGFAPDYDETRFFTAIVIIIALFLLVHILLAIKRSQSVENKYGPNPNEVTP